MPLITLCLAILLLLTGCVSSGNRSILDQERLDKITLNESTKADLKRLLGQPNSISKQSGNYSPIPGMPPAPGLSNVEVWTYSYLSVDVDGATFIPIVGLFAGGATSKMNTYTAVFDETGIVRHISSTQSEGRSGPASDGAPPEATESAPKNPWANKRSK